MRKGRLTDRNFIEQDAGALLAIPQLAKYSNTSFIAECLE
jgi:hypothetical protein